MHGQLVFQFLVGLEGPKRDKVVEALHPLLALVRVASGALLEEVRTFVVRELLVARLADRLDELEVVAVLEVGDVAELRLVHLLVAENAAEDDLMNRLADGENFRPDILLHRAVLCGLRADDDVVVVPLNGLELPVEVLQAVSLGGGSLLRLLPAVADVIHDGILADPLAVDILADVMDALAVDPVEGRGEIEGALLAAELAGGSGRKKAHHHAALAFRHFDEILKEGAARTLGGLETLVIALK
ncbi:MAG: hypothetical protein EBU90_21345 [Proteobacteria bacterium]|nr:hypothetical protein [Pseudomonadota bacterium]